SALVAPGLGRSGGSSPAIRGDARRIPTRTPASGRWDRLKLERVQAMERPAATQLETPLSRSSMAQNTVPGNCRLRAGYKASRQSSGLPLRVFSPVCALWASWWSHCGTVGGVDGEPNAGAPKYLVSPLVARFVASPNEATPGFPGVYSAGDVC